MSKHSDTLWQIEPHTKAKHEILRRYLGAWLAILGRKIPRLVYIDGFCGPGKYTGGEDGSPLIAVKEAIAQPALKTSEVTFIFIDHRPDRIEHLKKELSALEMPKTFHVYPIVNEFEGTLTKILDDLEREGRHLAPTFAFVDPFGFKGASFDVIQRLLSNDRTEVFINIMIEAINRFVEHPSPLDREHIRTLLGAGPTEIEQVTSSADRLEAFRQLYQKKLLQHAKFVRYFAMRDHRDSVIYYLFFATNHPLGHAKIKEVFWKVDPQSGFTFSDATNPDQLVLFENDSPRELANQLKRQFAGTTQLSQDVVTHVEDFTPYIASQAKKAMAQLEADGEIVVDTIKSDGEKRIRTKFPPGVLMHFKTQ
jgi:three-Cys-motif partner protein